MVDKKEEMDLELKQLREKYLKIYTSNNPIIAHNKIQDILREPKNRPLRLCFNFIGLNETCFLKELGEFFLKMGIPYKRANLYTATRKLAELNLIKIRKPVREELNKFDKLYYGSIGRRYRKKAYIYEFNNCFKNIKLLKFSLSLEHEELRRQSKI